MIKEIIGEHNHSSQILRNRVKLAENDMVANAAKNPNVPIRTTLANLSNALHAESEAAASSMSSLKALQMRVYRARIADQPKLPKAKNELLDMPDKYRNLDSGERFLVAAEDVGEEEILLVFMSNFGAGILNRYT